MSAVTIITNTSSIFNANPTLSNVEQYGVLFASDPAGNKLDVGLSPMYTEETILSLSA